MRHFHIWNLDIIVKLNISIFILSLLWSFIDILWGKTFWQHILWVLGHWFPKKSQVKGMTINFESCQMTMYQTCHLGKKIPCLHLHNHHVHCCCQGHRQGAAQKDQFYQQAGREPSDCYSLPLNRWKSLYCRLHPFLVDPEKEEIVLLKIYWKYILDQLLGIRNIILSTFYRNQNVHYTIRIYPIIAPVKFIISGLCRKTISTNTGVGNRATATSFPWTAGKLYATICIPFWSILERRNSFAEEILRILEIPLEIRNRSIISRFYYNQNLHYIIKCLWRNIHGHQTCWFFVNVFFKIRLKSEKLIFKEGRQRKSTNSTKNKPIISQSLSLSRCKMDITSPRTLAPLPYMGMFRKIP